MLIILTGPPGAGKSTIANLLSRRFKKSVSFSIDTLRDFIKSGNYAPWDLSGESQKTHRMTDKIVKLIIGEYLRNNFTVILDGIYSEKDIRNFKKKFKKVEGFILLPSLRVTKLRDKGRPKDQQIPQRVKVLHPHFSNKKFPNFVVIDSSEQTPQETTKVLYKNLQN